MCDKIDTLGALVCGAAAGVVTKLADHPLDTIKTRMQLASYNGVRHCAAELVHREGALALYAGLPAPVAACAVSSAVGFAGFAGGSQCYNFFVDADKQVVTSRVAFGGAVAGLGKAVVLTPFELVKSRVQATPRAWRGVVHCAVDTARVSGAGALFLGFAPMLAREVIGNVVWFGTHRAIMTKLTPEGEDHPGTLGSFVAAGSSGVAFWTCVMPFDTLKTRLQVNGHIWGAYTARRGAVRMIRQEGLGSLFLGYRATVMRTIPACTLIFNSYDFLAQRWIDGTSDVRIVPPHTSATAAEPASA